MKKGGDTSVISKPSLWKQGLCLLLFLPILQGCSLATLPLAGLPFIGGGERFILGHLGSRTKIKLKTISFSASMQANDNYATHVHLVLLFDPHMISEFLKMSSSDYFKDQKYKQLQRDHTSTINIFSYQVPPEAKIGPVKLDYSGSPVAGFVFAHYRTPGDHRIRIGEDRHLMIMLDRNDWHVMPHESQE